MQIEEKLMMINESAEKFNLSLNDVININKWLEEIKNITDTYFKLQVDYVNFFKNEPDYIDKLKQYHDKLSNDDIDYNTHDIENFLNGKENRI